MKSAYFTIHPGKNPPPQNGCRLISNFFLNTGFASSTFPIQPDFSQNQLAVIAINTGSPRTLLRGTSHMRLRARDHYTSSTLIGGKGGAGPSSLHTMLEGPTEHTCECKMEVKSTWVPTWHQMDHVSWSFGLFSKNYLLKVGLT